MLSNEDEAILNNIISLYFSQAAQIYTQIWQNFLLGGAAVRICMKICIACLHVGQMIFAGNKYLLLKRITVHKVIYIIIIIIILYWKLEPTSD